MAGPETGGETGGTRATTARCAAFVGPYLSGKTSLMEACLHQCGAIHQRGVVTEGTTVGDASPEARAHGMSVEISIGHGAYLGDRWTFLDCPGSIDFRQEARSALGVCDIAVVVCEPDPAQAVALTPILNFLDRNNIPHVLFINKMDNSTYRVREILEALQGASSRPLVLRHVPIRDGETVTGYVDLASERAYAYQEGAPSKLIEMPEYVLEREEEARQEMLEALADFDDTLLEQLLEDTVPKKEEIYQHLTSDLAGDLIVPVLLGSGINESGVTRLMKLLRHEAPNATQTLARLGGGSGDQIAQVFKTYHMQHIGKLSIARIFKGGFKDGTSLGSERISGMSRLMGHTLEKIKEASVGDVVGFGRMDGVSTGQTLGPNGPMSSGGLPCPAPISPVYHRALATETRDDDVKLSGALTKITEEDPSLVLDHTEDTHEMVLRGQGEIHLRIALERLSRMSGVTVNTGRPQVSYKETIRKGTSQHARHKKQSGGHGEFGDVHIDIKPLPRGAGFQFDQVIHGGSVPKNYIPAVQAGVEEYLKEGPLGFPVVDVAVTLTDGQHHAVDSSDMAFRKAASQAMREGMPNCQPVLLEPIHHVTVSIPTEATAKAQGVLTRRRAQILGFEAREGWPGWDQIQVHMPEAEIDDLIIELRSLSQGVGTYSAEFDHLQELQGRDADQVVEARKSA